MLVHVSLPLIILLHLFRTTKFLPFLTSVLFFLSSLGWVVTSQNLKFSWVPLLWVLMLMCFFLALLPVFPKLEVAAAPWKLQVFKYSSFFKFKFGYYLQISSSSLMKLIPSSLYKFDSLLIPPHGFHILYFLPNCKNALRRGTMSYSILYSNPLQHPAQHHSINAGWMHADLSE